MKKQKWFLLIGMSALLLMGFRDNKILPSPKSDAKGTLLVYVGSISTGYFNLLVGIHVEITSSVGVRYDVTMERGDQVMTDMTFVWRYDDKKKFMMRNNQTKKVEFENYDPNVSNSKDDLTIVGKGTIDKYACTQLRKKSDREEWNFWMSGEVPGYQQLLDKLFQLDPSYPEMVFGGTIFNYGGLVKTTQHATEPNGMEVNTEIHLVEANPDMSFAAKDFEFLKK